MDTKSIDPVKRSLQHVWLATTPEELNSRTLDRAFAFVADLPVPSFALLTSWSYSRTDADNIQTFDKLISHVRSTGLGFIRLRAHVGSQVVPFLWVYQIAADAATGLTKRYGATAMLLGSAEGDTLFYSSQSPPQNLGAFEATKVSEAFSAAYGGWCFFEWSVSGFWEWIARRTFLQHHSPDDYPFPAQFTHR